MESLSAFLLKESLTKRRLVMIVLDKIAPLKEFEVKVDSPVSKPIETN
jgi:hypothetical protein